VLTAASSVDGRAPEVLCLDRQGMRACFSSAHPLAAEAMQAEAIMRRGRLVTRQPPAAAPDAAEPEPASVEPGGGGGGGEVVPASLFPVEVDGGSSPRPMSADDEEPAISNRAQDSRRMMQALVSRVDRTAAGAAGAAAGGALAGGSGSGPGKPKARFSAHVASERGSARRQRHLSRQNQKQRRAENAGY
jgi:hypothetical protein